MAKEFFAESQTHQSNRMAPHWLVWCAAALLLPAAAVRAQSRIEVDASDRLKPISRNLFGKFTEHLGRNVYQGAWSQLVVNPEFAPARLWPEREVLESRLAGASALFGQQTLVRDAGSGIAAYWSASEAIRGRWIETRGRHLQQLRIGDGGGRIETGIFPPLQRVRSFELTVKGRSDHPATVRARLLNVAGDVIGEVSLPLAAGWSEKTYRIEAAPKRHRKGDPYLLALRFEGGTAVELDRVLLFPSDNVDGWEPEVVAYLRNAHLPLLRFPGGNFASGYHWEDGVGPLDERPVRPNPAWPELEWNHVGTEEWLRLCELTGAKPLICVNAGNGSAAEARRWVEYCNGSPSSPLGRQRAANRHPKPYGVRYWEVGNELYGAWQIGHTDGRGYAPRYEEFAKAMLAGDPSILLIANGLGKLRPAGDGSGYEPPVWNEELVKQNGRRVRSISVHPLMGRGAPRDADPIEVWKELVAFADGYGEYLDKLVGEPMRRAGLKPKVAITEMQIFTRYPSLPTNKSIAESLWLASFLHTCFRADGLVELLTHSALLNHGGGLGKNHGVVYADPVWWTTHLYASQPGVIPVRVKTESPRFSVAGKFLERRDDVPYLDASALLSPDDKTLSVFVINRDPENALAALLSFKGFAASQDVETVTVSAPSLTTRNTWDEPDRVRPVKTSLTLRGARLQRRFPALSLTRMTIRAAP